MGIDYFNLALKAIVLFAYLAICAITLIFTFSLKTYHKIDEMVKLEIIPTRIISPLERTVVSIDTWLMSRNKIVGPLLIILSTIDLKLFFSTINLF